MITLIKIYQLFFSRPLRILFGPGCKFTPTCSDYAIEAFRKNGFRKGSLLAFKRFLRCNPFSR
ncbi:membrane protein insertion efficiency factor YidD [Candidatus Woesebacteria bacterium CG_4_10_14_0_2_um_filter_44_9]|uniref:Membrane protein insertion efficiency factor YidD n=2 Tax=Candidatus Woeseibacteriota TaxID=1752722 RepID=A0A2H0BJ64_9BACT|nr:MAG: membrane protein insertion efficiency factor YidD [Candidatus Woesebacteria bacterium CG22_combo_CG10-13_8_21_14_all_45_10]PIZ46391.1 MAG: membrane protein insertion efficiency factor YidD [Candidatus Woesebacteria bacterium CG_4_10_14_0_2_um_filter_44_9]